MSTGPTDTPVVIGVDSSTQSCKVEVRDLAGGAVVGRASSPHPPTSPPVSEQDPYAWWVALVAAVRAALADIEPRRAAAIAVGGQQHGLVLLDAAGTPVRPAKLWNDTTSASDAERLVAAWGAKRWVELTRTIPVASITVSKLAWVVEHEPELLDRVDRVMLPHDYLTFRLCGEHVTDRGDASGTGWYDPVANRYLPEVFDLLGLNPDIWLAKLPRVLGPADGAGTVLRDVAAALAFPDGVLVGPGSGDNMAAALGLGLGVGDVAISLGTSGTAYALSETPTEDPSGAVAGFASACGRYLPLVCTLNATKVTDTVARWLGTDAAGLSALALAAVDDPGEVRLVPYFDGERTPNLPDATGELLGLRNDTTREQLAVAAHDGVLGGLLAGVDALERVGAQVGGRIVLTGGGARSAAYRRRAADLSGKRVAVAGTDEAVATGAAVQAAAVAGSEPAAEVIARWNL